MGHSSLLIQQYTSLGLRSGCIMVGVLIMVNSKNRQLTCSLYQLYPVRVVDNEFSGRKNIKQSESNWENEGKLKLIIINGKKINRNISYQVNSVNKRDCKIYGCTCRHIDINYFEKMHGRKYATIRCSNSIWHSASNKITQFDYVIKIKFVLKLVLETFWA